MHNRRTMGNEIRLAVRRLAKEPALALSSVLTLAVGIAACTAMFSIVEAVLLKPMDIAQPDRLVVMWPQSGDTAGEFSYNAYRELGRESASFDRVALSGSANWPIPVDIRLPDGRRTRATQSVVSETFFDVLGARPLLGRTFQSGDDRPGAPLVIVVSAAFWKTKLGGDPSIVDRTLAIGDHPWRIVGVMPPEFFYPAGADFWTPAGTLLALTSQDKSSAAIEKIFDTVGAFHLLGRLKPGVSTTRAQTDVNRWWTSRKANIPGRVTVTPFLDHLFGASRRALWLLMVAVGLVLVIACANVAGLLVARNALRSREVAVRRALGASALQIVRQNVIEAGVLAAAGGIAAVAIAAAALRGLIALSPPAVVRLSETRVDLIVLAVCLLITGAVTLGVALVPALQSRRVAGIAAMNGLAVRDSGRAIRADTRRALVVVQVAITLTLLVASALAAQSFMRLAALDLGFDPAKVLTLDIGRLDQSRYATYPARLRAVAALRTELERLPGVTSAAAVLIRPFAHGVIGWDSALLLEGQPDVDANWLKNAFVNFEAVTPRYFQTMAIRLRSGRDFSEADRAGAPLVAIVSNNLASRLWPAQNPIGKRLVDSFERPTDGGAPQWRTVVGVADAAHYRELDRTRFDFYVPLAQSASFDPEHIVARTSGDPRALIPAAATVLSSIDTQLTAADITTMEDIVGRVRAPWRFNMLLFSMFGGLSIGLTAIGVVGLIVSTVNWRRREIAVRLALGAQRHTVVSLIAVQGAKLIVIGVGVGLFASLLASRLLSSLLFGVAAADPRTLILAAAGVLALGMLASYLPARRAAGLDPCRIFREE
jgi:putative ABC transport system permease protein